MLDSDSCLFFQIGGDMEDLEVQWHTPSSEELDAAQRLASSVLVYPQKLLGTASAAEESLPSLKDITRAALDLQSVVKGTIALLGDFDDSVICQRPTIAPSTLQKRHFTQRAEFPLFTAASKAALPEVGLPNVSAGASDMPSSLATESLRTRLARLVDAVLRRLSHCESASPEAWKSLIRISLSLLFESGVWSQTYSKLSGLNQFARKQHREYSSGRRCVLRYLLVEQCELIYYCRAELCRSRLRLTPVALSLFESLLDLCIHDQPVVHCYAAETVIRATSTFPELLPRTLEYALQQVDTTSLRHHQLRGAIGLLIDEGIMLVSNSEWSLLQRWILVLCRSHRHEDQIVQELLHELFLRHARYFQCMRLQPLQMIPQYQHLIDDETRKLQLERLEVQSVESQECRRQLISTLLQIVKPTEGSMGKSPNSGSKTVSHPIHWRYELVSATYLWLLLREDQSVSAEVLQYFVDLMLGNFAPLRLVGFASVCVSIRGPLCRAANGALQPTNLRRETIQGAALVQDVLKPLQTLSFESLQINSEEEWLQTQFVDANDAGFWSDHVDVTSYLPSSKIESLSSLDELVLQRIEEQLINQVKLFLKHLVDDHQSLHSGSGEDVDGAGTSDGITAFAYIYSCWPRDRFPGFSKDLDIQHVYLVQSLVESLTFSGTKFAMSLIEELGELVSKLSEVDMQVTAAEVLAGIVRGIRHWPFPQQSQIRERIVEYVEAVAGRCPLESLDTWVDSMRLCADQCDPRRIMWLISPLRTLLKGRSWSSLSPSEQMRRLRLLGAFVLEFGWRGQCLRDEILPLIEQNAVELTAYQHVREEVGTLLFLLRDIDRRIDSNSLQRVAASKELTAFTTGLEQRLNSKDADAVKHLVDMSLYWMMVSFSYGDVHSFGDLYTTLLPHILSATRQSDRELAELAKYITEVGAWAHYSPTSLTLLLNEIERIVLESESNWHIRRGALSMLIVLLPRHAFILPSPQLDKMVTLLSKLLCDPQLETRQLASDTFSSLVSSVGARISVPRLLTVFTSLAETPLSGRRKKRRRAVDVSEKAEEDEDDRAHKGALQRHSGVLGLAALIKSEPFDCPPWLPSALQLVSSHISDPAPIDVTVKDVLLSFKRTHQDTWHLLRRRFTEEQLEALAAAHVAPSYFA